LDLDGDAHGEVDWWRIFFEILFWEDESQRRDFYLIKGTLMDRIITIVIILSRFESAGQWIISPISINPNPKASSV